MVVSELQTSRVNVSEMEIVTVFQVKEEMKHYMVKHKTLGERHVYVGLCDGVLTKWVTFEDWNGKLRFTGGGYEDSNGREILVFEDDEDGWGEW